MVNMNDSRNAGFVDSFCCHPVALTEPPRAALKAIASATQVGAIAPSTVVRRDNLSQETENKSSIHNRSERLASPKILLQCIVLMVNPVRKYSSKCA